MSTTRRRLLRDFAALTAGSVLLDEWYGTRPGFAAECQTPNARPRVGCIGMGGMGKGDARAAKRYGDIVAVCDVDRDRAAAAAADPGLGAGKADVYEDYRKLLERQDVDLVTISTPDHWHTRQLLDALRARKDVYCQKPLTLTIEEGAQIAKAVKETGRVVQVGTQQRSENRNMFLTAVAMVREGRIGKVKRVTCAIGGAPTGGPFPVAEVPPGLNWDLWLGQCPLVEYRKERCHYTFRWWYEYSGGKLTDWGAHHVDIAQWALGMEGSGPSLVEPLAVKHPVEFREGHPVAPDRFNTALSFQVRCLFAGGVEMLIRDDTENGITFEGEKGTFFVSRSKLTGEPVEALKENPIPESVLVALRNGKRLDGHMGNFIECVKDRGKPVSDVFTHHRAMTTCHLANIALRLGRKVEWDPAAERIVGDAAADQWRAREARKGWETNW